MAASLQRRTPDWIMNPSSSDIRFCCLLFFFIVLVSFHWLFCFSEILISKCFVFFSACSCSLLWAPPPPAPGDFLNSKMIILFFHPILLRWVQKYEAIFIFELYFILNILTLNIHVLITQSLSWEGLFINIIQIVPWPFLYIYLYWIYPSLHHVESY